MTIWKLFHVNYGCKNVLKSTCLNARTEFLFQFYSSYSVLHSTLLYPESSHRVLNLQDNYNKKSKHSYAFEIDILDRHTLVIIEKLHYYEEMLMLYKIMSCLFH